MGFFFLLSSSLAFLFFNLFVFRAHAVFCHDDERSALLQFKQSMAIDKLASSYEGAYPKVLSWKSEEENSNCCSWDGVECDEKTGHVIGLILNSSCLYGSINSNTSLFRLVHLQKLNLADNHFNYTLIPSAIGQLSKLTHLNLSDSWFYGQIPLEISYLSKLTFLDLSTQFDVNDPTKQYRLLELKNPSLSSMIQNLTSLQLLCLTSVHIPSTVPFFLTNFTSLKSLVLQNCGLYGKFPVNIFHLPNLQVLNLGWNKILTGCLPEFEQRSLLKQLVTAGTSFSGSIPFSIERLESLEVLCLGRCNFSGPLPSSLGGLTQLTSLVLRENHFGGPIPSWVGNLTQLQTLDLGDINLNGSIPSSFQNLCQLSYLSLYNNHITGSIPSWIGNLTKLQTLGLGGNNLNGSIPSSFQNLCQLSYLSLGNNHITGSIPSWIGNLTKLQTLDLGGNNLNGSIPSSFQNLCQLSYLSLGNNHITGSIPSWIGNLTKLQTLDLGGNNLNCYIPSSFQNLCQLSYLGLGNNHITGLIPSWIGNLTNLVGLYLQTNEFYGSIPISLPKLMNLETLYLYDNNLSGNVEFDMFFTMRSLNDLQLGGNTLSVLFSHQININATNSKFIGLGLGSCNLSVFPNFLRHQNSLVWLDLSRNKIYGHIPKWMWNISVKTLTFLFLGDNFLIDFPQPPPTFLPWVNLWNLDLSFNLLQGNLPIAPTSIQYYIISNNRLTGKISPLMCNLSSLRRLDLSSNNLSGTVPQCLEKLNSLLVLNLKNNSFDGAIPQLCAFLSNLKMIDLSKNRFKGQLPRSLATCMVLEYLDLGNNQLIDVFPAWLGTLPQLKILCLRHNRLYGFIKKLKQNFWFPELRVIDLSYNNFTGKLPFKYKLLWGAMKAINTSDVGYMKAKEIVDQTRTYAAFSMDYTYSTTIVNKGLERYYAVILDNFAEIDFSCNKFNGQIPGFIGDLKALHSLNLSFNNLTGSIPSSLENLMELESLDLSNNKLSGEIPQQLTGLTFLQSFDVSYNNLTGPIPQANQFGTFDNSSFEGNPGLCGMPLSNKCGDSKASPLPPSVVEENDDSESSIELDWKFVLAGCISGFIVGVALGDMVITKRRGWFVKAFRRIPPKIEIKQLRN